MIAWTSIRLHLDMQLLSTSSRDYLMMAQLSIQKSGNVTACFGSTILALLLMYKSLGASYLCDCVM